MQFVARVNRVDVRRRRLQGIPGRPVEPARQQAAVQAQRLLEAEPARHGDNRAHTVERSRFQAGQVGCAASAAPEQAAVAQFSGPRKPRIEAVRHRLRQPQAPVLRAPAGLLFAVVCHVGGLFIGRIDGRSGLERKAALAGHRIDAGQRQAGNQCVELRIVLRRQLQPQCADNLEGRAGTAVDAAVVLQGGQAQGTAGRIEPVEIDHVAPVGGVDLAGAGAGRSEHVAVFRIQDHHARVASRRRRRAPAAPRAIPLAAAHADAVQRTLRCRLQPQVDGQARSVRAACDAPQHAGDAVGVTGLKTQQRGQARASCCRTGRAVAP
jgi:hypothetical protein